MANSVAQGRDLAKKHKKKLKNKIGKAIGYAGEVAKTVSDYGTPAGIAMTVASKIKQKIKDRGMPKGPFKRISTEPTPEMIKRFRDGKIKRKMGGGMMNKPMGYDQGGPSFMDKIVDNMGKDYDNALNKEMSKEIRNRQKVNKRDGSVETAEYDIDHNKMESNAVNKVKKKYGFDKGGMARGMGAAIKGGKFQGVF